VFAPGCLGVWFLVACLGVCVFLFWCFGVLVFWCFGVLVFLCFGVLVFWCFGVLAFWRFGVLAFWCLFWMFVLDSCVFGFEVRDRCGGDVIVVAVT
jgi:hypothetical protein